MLDGTVVLYRTMVKSYSRMLDRPVVKPYFMMLEGSFERFIVKPYSRMYETLVKHYCRMMIKSIVNPYFKMLDRPMYPYYAMLLGML